MVISLLNSRFPTYICFSGTYSDGWMCFTKANTFIHFTKAITFPVYAKVRVRDFINAYSSTSLGTCVARVES